MNRLAGLVVSTAPMVRHQLRSRATHCSIVNTHILGRLGSRANSTNASSTNVAPEMPKAAGAQQNNTNLPPPALNKLSPSEQMYMRKVNELNQKRYQEFRKSRLHARIAFSTIALFILTTYFYTMYAVKQETFLDDLEVPEPPDPAVKTFKR